MLSGKRGVKRLTAEQQAEIIRLRKEGAKLADIKVATGLGMSTIVVILRSAGLRRQDGFRSDVQS